LSKKNHFIEAEEEEEEEHSQKENAKRTLELWMAKKEGKMKFFWASNCEEETLFL
jgi:hypothetical protein